MATEIILLCDNSGTAQGTTATLASAKSGLGTLNLTDGTATRYFGHSGVTGTLGLGALVRKASDTGVTATVAVCTTGAILLKNISGGTFASGDTVETSDSLNSVTLNTAADSAILAIEHGNFASTTPPYDFSITANATNYVIFRAQSGAKHDGTPDSGARLVASAGGFSFLMTAPGYSKVYDMEFRQTGTGTRYPFRSGTYNNIQRCIFRNASGANGAIYISDNSNAYSSLFHDTPGVGVEDNGTDCTFGLYGCTIVNCTSYAVNTGTGSVATIIGCIGYNNTSGFFGGAGSTDASCDYNASDVAEASIPGGTGKNNVGSLSSTATDIFSSPGSADYDYNIVAGTPTDNIREGWVASPPAGSSPDLAQNTRPQGTNATIGAFEYLAPATVGITRTGTMGFTVTETNNSLTRATPVGFTLAQSTAVAAAPTTIETPEGLHRIHSGIIAEFAAGLNGRLET